METKKPRLKKFTRNNIDLAALVRAVRSLAERFPDMVYHKPMGGVCSYKRTRQPDGDMSGCIIGEALRSIGISTAGLDFSAIVSNSSIEGLLTKRGFDPGNDDVEWLTTVQEQQDLLVPWAKAVHVADKRVARFR